MPFRNGNTPVPMDVLGPFQSPIEVRGHNRNAAPEATRGTYVPLVFAPGEAFQFDWGEDWASINGQNTRLQLAHFKLSYSRAFMLCAYLLQTHVMLFDAHNHAFVELGGVAERGIYDNMRTAVDRVGRGKAPVINARFQGMITMLKSLKRYGMAQSFGDLSKQSSPAYQQAESTLKWWVSFRYKLTIIHFDLFKLLHHPVARLTPVAYFPANL